MCGVSRRVMSVPFRRGGKSVQLCSSQTCIELAGSGLTQQAIGAVGSQAAVIPSVGSSNGTSIQLVVSHHIGHTMILLMLYLNYLVGLAAHQSTQERAAFLAQHMRLKLGGAVGPTSSLTSSSLTQFEHHNAQPGEKHIYIGWQVCQYIFSSTLSLEVTVSISSSDSLL